MANSNDANDRRWVEERLKSLETPQPFDPSHPAAKARLHERQAAARRARRAWTTAAVIGMGIVALAALPWGAIVIAITTSPPTATIPARKLKRLIPIPPPMLKSQALCRFCDIVGVYRSKSIAKHV